MMGAVPAHSVATVATKAATVAAEAAVAQAPAVASEAPVPPEAAAPEAAAPEAAVLGHFVRRPFVVCLLQHVAEVRFVGGRRGRPAD